MIEPPRPLAQCPPRLRESVRGVFTDIDDTLTRDGRLQVAAFSALARLREAGLLVVPVTGRPAGWCDHIARMWPVDGVVGENGALYMRYETESRRMLRAFADDDATREAHRTRLGELARRILREVPGCALASDQPYRESDLAIDYCEDVPRLDSAAVARIVGMFEAAGAHAKVSSIHVNGWFADCDKLSMVRRYMRECHGVDLDAERDRYLYIGDSPNDAPMFGYFPIAVGVANVMAFAGEIEPMPAFITDAPCGDGFRQMVDWLVGDERGS